MLKIKNIKIKNFRSIVDIDIDTDKLNIFVGLNDAGKSNVLKALNLFLMVRLNLELYLILKQIILNMHL